MDTMKAIDKAQIEFLKKIGYFDSTGHVKQQKKSKHNRNRYIGELLYSFDFNEFKHSLWDGRDAGYNNFKLDIMVPSNKKKIQIIGIDNIIDHINNTPIPKRHKLEIEKRIMERII